MNIEWICKSLLVSASVAWIISLEVRLRIYKSKLVMSQQEVQDESIVASVHNFTDNALAIAVAKDLGPAIENVATNILSEQRAETKD